MALKRAWVDKKDCCDAEQHHRTLLVCIMQRLQLTTKVFETPLEVESTITLLMGMLPWKMNTKPRDKDFMMALFKKHDLAEPTYTQGRSTMDEAQKLIGSGFYLKRNSLNPCGSLHNIMHRLTFSRKIPPRRCRDHVQRQDGAAGEPFMYR